MSSNAEHTRLIERRTVSRKTPADGKLEITKVAAERLAPLGARFALVVDAHGGEGEIGTMPCTCRGGDAPHVHYFIASELLRVLSAGQDVDVVLDGDGNRLLVVSA